MHTRAWMLMGSAAVLAGLLAGCGMKKEAAPPPPPPVVVSNVTEKPGQVVEQTAVTVTAKVVNVDQKGRVVTLRNAAGEVFAVEVGDEVKNLAQVKKGDDVVATYYESMAISVRKPGEAKPAAEGRDTLATAKPGEKPGGIAARETTITATVVGLDKGKGTITVKGPRGKVVTVKAREPRRLEHVKVGDLLEVVYTEAVAISVEKPTKH